MAPSDLRGFEGSNFKTTMLRVLQRMTEVKEIPCVAQAPWVCCSLGSAPTCHSPCFSVPACAKTPQI